MQTNHPTNRLFMHNVGERVVLKGARQARLLFITKIRDDGYYELSSEKGRLVFTASSCHEVEKENQNG